MNRNLDGTELTNQQLRDIAIANGTDAAQLAAICGALHSHNMVRSHLKRITAATRFGMFNRGELQLRTEVRTLNG